MSTKITKTGLVDLMAAHSGSSKKDADAALNALLFVLNEQLVLGNEVELKGIGTFKIGASSERSGRNPLTGKEMTIPAKKVLKFKASSVIKENINR